MPEQEPDRSQGPLLPEPGKDERETAETERAADQTKKGHTVTSVRGYGEAGRTFARPGFLQRKVSFQLRAPAYREALLPSMYPRFASAVV